MEVEFEILAILATAFLFTLVGFVFENYKISVSSKMLAAIAWWSLALGFVAATPSFLAFAMLFMGIGIVMVFAAVNDVLEMFSGKEKERKDWHKRDDELF